MIISHRFKFVFFCNPETGAEPVVRLLAPLSEEPVVSFESHSPDRPFYSSMSPAEANVAFRQNGRNLDDYTCISTIENPFTRLPRLFHRITQEDRFIKIRRLIGTAPASFETWLAQASLGGRGGGGALHQRWRRFGTWSADHWSGGHIQHFIKREHLESGLASILAQLNLPLSTAGLGADPIQTYPEHLSARAITLLKSRYHNDLERFNYTESDQSEAA